MMPKLSIPEALLKITPYRGGASSIARQKKAIKLSSNEGALGASPKALRAFKKNAKPLSLYPEGAATLLRQTLAEQHAIPANQIICGGGSDDLLQLLTRFALYKGGEAIHSQWGFALYPTLIRANGGIPVAAPEKNFRADIDAIVKKANSKTKIVLLANPNNPTGTYLTYDELKTLRKKLPQHILLVIDSAYAEYIDAKAYEAGIKLVKQNDNVVMTRTFSKIYGLAALRLGWAFLPPKLADVINRIRQPFNVPTPTLYAGIAAAKDTAFLKRAQAHNKKWRDRMKQALPTLNATDTMANFLLLNFQSKNRANTAWRLLASKGFILRQMGEYGLDSYLRLTIGTASVNRKVLRLLKQFEAR